MAKNITASERIWINEDRTKAVKEGDESAAFLLAAEGGTISAEDAEKYGISEDGKLSGGASKKATSSSTAHVSEGDIATRDGVLKPSKGAKK